mmetsp:Transcript_17331/g.21900  ORF Transcript_17331/g.21900 Transcript_17331/m.21900 type:complete len:517 (-) Transcript_17331:86-1636(-)
MTQGTKRKADALDESVLEPHTNGFYIKIAPDKSMTGVDGTMTRLCASVAGQIYNSSKAEDFNLSIGDIEADVVHFEDHGTPYEGVTPNMAAVVRGSTMILGWQGSTTISDFIADFNMVPIVSSRWSKVSKEIKVHAGFAANVDNDFALLDSELVKKMEEHKITELIMTGHSLGGAIAQVAQLCVQAALHDKTSVWSQYKENLAPTFSVRTVAFSAPMSISTVAPTSPKTTDFLKEVAAKSCNIIYHLDVIPRAFSQLKFIDDALKNVIEGIDGSDVFKKLNLPQFASMFVNVQEAILDQYKGVKESKATKPIIDVAKTFNHYGNVIHYENDAAQPVIYRDFNHDEASCDKKFSDLKWVPQDERMDHIGNLTHDHNNTVRGPGLGYNIPDDKLAGKCYMMDEFEILKGQHDIGSPIPFTDFNDCVKKAKEGMHTAAYAAVAVWDKNNTGEEKFNKPGTLYIKKCVPGKSEDAKSIGVSFWNKGSKNKATFWRTACLVDWTEEGEPSADIHDGVVELK